MSKLQIKWYRSKKKNKSSPCCWMKMCFKIFSIWSSVNKWAQISIGQPWSHADLNAGPLPLLWTPPMLKPSKDVVSALFLVLLARKLWEDPSAADHTRVTYKALDLISAGVHISHMHCIGAEIHQNWLWKYDHWI